MATYVKVRGSHRFDQTWRSPAWSDARGIHTLRHVRKPGRVLRERAAARYQGGHLK